jgi:ABC-2 type transport system permease protein
LKTWQAKGIPMNNALKQAIPIKVDISAIGNAGYGYGSFLLVGLFILILHQLMLISLCESVARENEMKTVNDWFNASGRKTLKALGNKVLPYFLIFIIYYLFVPTLPFQAFHLVQYGNFSSILLLGFSAFLVLGEIGLLLGSFFKSQLQALQFTAVMSIPLFLVSGFSWPIEQMPLSLQLLNYLLPTHFLLLPFQSITQLGSTTQEQLPSLLVLWIQAIIYFLLLKWRYSNVFQKVENDVEANPNRQGDNPFHSQTF